MAIRVCRIYAFDGMRDPCAMERPAVDPQSDQTADEFTLYLYGYNSHEFALYLYGRGRKQVTWTLITDADNG